MEIIPQKKEFWGVIWSAKLVCIYKIISIIFDTAEYCKIKISKIYKKCDDIMSISSEVASFYFSVYVTSYSLLYKYLENSGFWLHILVVIYILLFPFIGVTAIRSMGSGKE